MPASRATTRLPSVRRVDSDRRRDSGSTTHGIVRWPRVAARQHAAQVQMTKLYNIKNNDMLYFLLFSVVLIPFQFIADVFTLSVLELFHGWKIYDYLIYTRYRFLQRETRWKGLEDSLDECIDESVRTLDQMCFSSQYYMMMTVQARPRRPSHFHFGPRRDRDRRSSRDAVRSGPNSDRRPSLMDTSRINDERVPEHRRNARNRRRSTAS